MRILDKLKSVLQPSAEKPVAPRLDPEQFIYVKLPGNIQPIQRGELFEDRIDPILSEAGLGSVSGGGSSLTDPLPDGRRLVAFCGIDIDTLKRDEALPVLRDLLPKLEAPVGTELHYTRSGVKLQDEFTNAGWSTERPRTFLHPGFDV
jgi:hypothetical protein